MHTIKYKRALITRVHRVRGQLDAVEHALTEERGCEAVVQLIAAARGAINALAAEVLCEHLTSHVSAPRLPGPERARASAELEGVIRQLVARP
jgi:FrmR/RcnR family transcriptional regulator, repressor of rcnA expression